MRYTPLLLLPVLLLTACPAVDTKELNFTRSKPKLSDLVGTWTPDRRSMEDIRTRGRYTNIHPTITLLLDGTFSIRDMPDWWSDAFGESSGAVESLDGKWSLTQENNIWDVWVLDLDTPTFGAHVHLYRQEPPFALFIRVGDPNSAHAMIFERTKQR